MCIADAAAAAVRAERDRNVQVVFVEGVFDMTTLLYGFRLFRFNVVYASKLHTTARQSIYKYCANGVFLCCG